MLKNFFILLIIVFSFQFSQKASAKVCQWHDGAFIANHFVVTMYTVLLKESKQAGLANNGATIKTDHDIGNGWRITSIKGNYADVEYRNESVNLAAHQGWCWDSPALPSGWVDSLNPKVTWAFADVMVFPGFWERMGVASLKDGQSFNCHGTTFNRWCEVKN